MAKHTYGFPTGTDPDEAGSQAVAKARESRYIDDQTRYWYQIVETDEHRANNEMCVVIRTDEQ